MKRNSRLFVCVLAALLMLPAVSCSQGDDPVQAQLPSEDSASETETETEDTTDKLFTVTAEDNGDRTFTVLTMERHYYEYDAAELSGELVNDAVYTRNLAVEELLGISLEAVVKPGEYDGGQKEQYWELIRASAMAADGAFDVVTGMISCMQPIATPDLFLDILTLEDVNLSNPWWVSGQKEDLSINGKLLNVIGDASLSMYKDFAVVFANLSKMENLNMEDIYSVVREGRWTLDTLCEMGTMGAEDTNGDGIISEEADTFGLVVDQVAFWACQASFELPMVKLNADGIPMVVGLTDPFTTALDKAAAFLSADPVLIVGANTGTEVFIEDRSLFYQAKMNAVDKLREMENDFAILPFPKRDEPQESYKTLIATSTQLTYVPVVTNDISLTGKALEALAYYGYKGVVPAYYEVALKERYSRDTHTQEMLNLIREGAVLPLEYAYSTALNWPHTIFANAALKNEAGKIASTIQSNSRSWETSIAKLMENYK